MAMAVIDGAIHAIRSIVNPDKLVHLGPGIGLGARRQPKGTSIAPIKIFVWRTCPWMYDSKASS
jgi:hypothetical protein